MKIPFIVGRQIYLRPLEAQDLNEKYLTWLNDEEVNRYLESGIFPQTKRDLDRFYNQVIGSPNQIVLAIADKETKQHIGNVKLGQIDWVHRRATFGILIGDKQFWGKGIGTEATQLMVEYAFGRLNLRRIVLGVHAEHKSAVRAYEKVGFKIEGRFREDLFHENQYKDSLWMALLRSEYNYSARNKSE